MGKSDAAVRKIKSRAIAKLSLLVEDERKSPSNRRELEDLLMSFADRRGRGPAFRTGSGPYEVAGLLGRGGNGRVFRVLNEGGRSSP